jgi:predicted lactoylglutathione lyase
MISWSAARGETTLCATLPHNGEPATVGNGSMVSLRVQSREQVRAVYERAMSLGAHDEGALGPRGHNGFYAGYFRDPDGNKLGVFCIERPESALSDLRKGP